MTTIACCIITLGEPTLEEAVACVRPHVDEVVVIYTGSGIIIASDDWVENWRKAHPGDKVFWQTFGDDFSAARAESFRHATSEYVTWMDSDDVIVGAEHLRDACRPGARVVCPYEYAQDGEGRCVVLQARERIVPNDGTYCWRRPVHEHLVRADGRAPVDAREDRIVWRHQRKPDAPWSDRNLRILEAYRDRNPGSGQDAWLRMNLALELQNAHRYGEALEHFRAYADLSDNPEEKAFVCVRAVDCELAAADLFKPETQQRAIDWAKRAQALQLDRFEGYYAEARVHSIPALTLGDKGANELTVHWAKRALATPMSDTPMATRPMDRALAIHELLRVVSEHLCDWQGALDATEAAMLVKRDDAGLRLAKKRYRALLSIALLEDAPKPTGLDIVFACGPSNDFFDPEVYEKRGVGGSETAVIEMARRLAARGHKVRVYCLCGREGTWDGVDYLDYRGDHAGSCDVLVAWRSDRMLTWMRSRVRVIWVHDLAISGMEKKPAARPDRVFALSEFHKRRLVETHGFDPDLVWVTRNGIDLQRFETEVERNPHKAIYSSSPDRGLALLLDLWPLVRAWVPDAELHVYYGFETWRSLSKEFGGAMQQYLVRNLEGRARSTEGVVYHGGVDQKTLARAMLAAGVWALPTWFEETNCISAMEAQAAGLYIVSSANGALPETVGDRGALVEGEWLSTEYRAEFVDHVVNAMTGLWDDGDERTTREQNLRVYAREHFGWDGVVDVWEGEFRRLLDGQALRVTPVANAGKPRVRLMLSRTGTGGQVLDPRDPSGGTFGGGGKAGFMGLVRALGRLGRYEVTAASTFRDRDLVVDGVRYVDIDEPLPVPEVAIGYYDVRVLQHLIGPFRIGLHHTLFPYLAWDFIDLNTAPSKYAVDYLRRMRPRARWEVLPNAVEGLGHVAWDPVPGRIIHHTSPDRGLYNLLERWPEIRARVPNATLHVGGDPQSIAEANASLFLRDSLSGEMSRRLADGMKTAKEVGGVKFLGALPRAELLEEIRHASVFAAPFEVMIPSETWSISVHECCAIGVPVVMSPVDALRSLWYGVVAEVTPEIAEDRGEFVDAVVRVLTDPDYARRMSVRQREGVTKFSFDRMARTVESWIDAALAAKRRSP